MTRPRHHHRAASSPGFSLAELVVVVLIIAIAAAIALPRYNDSLNHYRAYSAAHRLVYDLAMTQARARALSTSQTLSFAGSTYQVPGMMDPNHPALAYVVDLTAAPYDASISQVLFTNGAMQISFSGYGVPNTGGSITLQAGTNIRTVTIDASSGATTIQ